MSSNDSGSSALGVIVIAVAVAWGASKGWFYQTGQEWFDTCWASLNTKAPTTAAEAAAWAQCEPQTKKALFDAGYVFGGNPEHAATPELNSTVRCARTGY